MTPPRPLPPCPHCQNTGKIKIPHPLKPVSKRIVIKCEKCARWRRLAGGKRNA